jgi:hypothetical protein
MLSFSAIIWPDKAVGSSNVQGCKAALCVPWGVYIPVITFCFDTRNASSVKPFVLVGDTGEIPGIAL